MASWKERNGAYQITVSMGRNVYGKQILKTTTFKPPEGLTPKKKLKAVDDFAKDFEKKCREHKILNGEKITLHEFIKLWMEDEAKQELQPGTLEKYQQIIDGFILPNIGHLKLTELKPQTIKHFFVSLTKDGCRHDGKPGGYSKGTINKISNVLSSILRTAVVWEMIERNPCKDVRAKAENTADKIKFFTPQQTALFLDYIEHPYTIHTKGHTRIDDTGKPYTVADYTSTKELSEQLKVLFVLAIYTGLRKGELVALQWSDIDFENNAVAVNKAASVVNHEQIVKAPKTRNSFRIVSIPHSLTERLRKLQLEQTRYRLKVGSYWQGEGWIFTQDNGKQMSYYTPGNALRDILTHYNTDKAEADKLPMIPFHGLRHTKATIQIAAGTDVRTVSAIMGHRETSTTMNIYSHSLQTAEQEAVNKMEKLLAKQA